MLGVRFKKQKKTLLYDIFFLIFQLMLNAIKPNFPYKNNNFELGKVLT